MELEQFSSRRIPWEKYPALRREPEARRWLELCDLRGRPQNTLDTYAKAIEAYLQFLNGVRLGLLEATELEVAHYLNFMRLQGSRSARSPSAPLSEATIQLRLSVVRGLYDHLVRRGLIEAHPLPPPRRGTEKPLQLSAGEEPLPWIPSSREWRDFLTEARQARLRDRVMVLLAYEGALRRESLVRLEFEDIDLERRLVKVRPSNVKGGRSVVVKFSEPTKFLYTKYVKFLEEDMGAACLGRARIFRSESNRNRGGAITEDTWNKVVKEIAVRAGLPRFSPHTLRHLRLTHMAEADFKLADIARYAGHISLDSTRLYVHLSDLDLIQAIATSTHLMTHQTELASRL